MNWENYFNSANLPDGNYRSIVGYAAESLAIGRAMQCGYNLFFKAWRDSPYDGVLDYNGVLFRVEIKGSRSNSLSVTSGGRSGQQINRESEDRTHILNRGDVDYLLGVNHFNGDCYIIHVELLSIFNLQALTFNKLELFKEKWVSFQGINLNGVEFTSELLKSGFLGQSYEDLLRIAESIEITEAEEAEEAEEANDYSIEWPGFKGNRITGLNYRQILTVKIWQKILSPQAD